MIYLATRPTLFAFLPSALMVPEPREFCFVWMICARLLRFTAFSHPPLRAGNPADVEQRVALLSGNAKPAVQSQVMGYFLTNPGELHRCNSWSLLNATKIQQNTI